MAAMKEGGEVGGSAAIKRRKKVALGEDHDWLLVLEAERVEPGSMEVAVNTVEKRTRVRNREWDLRNITNIVCLFDVVGRICLLGLGL